MERQRATFAIRVGTAKARAKVDVTTRGLLALGTGVSMILFSSAAIVAAARFSPR
jgi:hypothetical protein